MRARRRFGQNFLHDRGIIRHINSTINASCADHMVEIGPGHGELTTALAASGCQLDLIEIDRDLVSNLQDRFGGNDRVTIHEGDALKFDLPALPRVAGAGPLRIVGNLPYNISTPLLFRLFRHIDIIGDMTFMLQAEVVDRMAADRSTRAYGRLSIMTQYHCEAEKMFEVPPSAFTPQPKVTSAIVRLTPRHRATTAADTKLMETLLARAFSQRRKTVRNALSQYLDEDELSALDIDARARPENLSVDEYVRCVNHVHVRDTAQ
jgi:16S rRNA (adenine1518-N6/adenine1519-N6)-dimethyltransferase